MRRIIQSIQILTICSFLILSSCEKEEVLNYDPDLIGTWVLEETHEDITTVEVFTFESDLTGLYNNFEKDQAADSPSPITYFVDNKEISITLLGWDTTVIGSYSFSTHTGESFERLHLTIDGNTKTLSRRYSGGYN